MALCSTPLFSVLRHPQCMNCHSNGDFPRQGDDGHPHTMNVRRGTDGHGVTAEKCGTCHQDHNLSESHLPPGAPNWGLPAATTPMIWQGLSDAQLCRSIKDPKQNKRSRHYDKSSRISLCHFGDSIASGDRDRSSQRASMAASFS